MEGHVLKTNRGLSMELGIKKWNNIYKMYILKISNEKILN